MELRQSTNRLSKLPNRDFFGQSLIVSFTKKYYNHVNFKTNGPFLNDETEAAVQLYPDEYPRRIF